MADLSDFKRCQIVGARMAELFSVARRSVSKVMTAFVKEGKTSSQKQNCGRKRKLSDRNRRTLTRIVKKDHKNRAPKITAELNDHFGNRVSSKTVRRELHKARIHEMTAIRKPY